MDGSLQVPQVRLIGENDPMRGSAESFVRERFAAAFSADIRELMPNLMVGTSATGAIVSCLGFREAASAPLFLEQYLSEPIEDLLSSRFGLGVERRHIVEIGHFSGISRGCGRRLIPSLLKHLADRNLDWLAFTATKSLRELLVRLGLQPLPLAVARAQCIAEPGSWGCYYDDDPWVMGGPLAWSKGTRI